jgi:Protein of unknown function (DUF2613)
VRIVVGVVAAFLAGLALATGVTVAVEMNSSPDKGLNLESVDKPNPWFGAVDYGNRP